MAGFYEVNDGTVDRFNLALKAHDGPTVARIMEEVGSCGWSSLARKSNESDKFGRLQIPRTNFESHLDPNHETVQVRVLYLHDSPVISKNTDIRCEKKP